MNTVELAKQLAEHNHYVTKNPLCFTKGIGENIANPQLLLDMWTYMFLGEKGMEHAADSWNTYAEAAEAAYLHSPLGQSDPGCEWSVYCRWDNGWGWNHTRLSDTLRARTRNSAMEKADTLAREHMPSLSHTKQYEVHVIPTVLGE